MTAPIVSNLFTLAFGLPGHMEWIVLLVLGLLIFGKRLPDVGRSIGRSIVEFKKGIKGIEDEIEGESSKSDQRLDQQSNKNIEDTNIGSSRVDDSKVVIGTGETDVKTD